MKPLHRQLLLLALIIFWVWVILWWGSETANYIWEKLSYIAKARTIDFVWALVTIALLVIVILLLKHKSRLEELGCKYLEEKWEREK